MTCLKPRSQFVSELETYKFLLRNGYWLKSISLIFCPAAKDSFCSHSEFGLSSVQFSLSVVSDSLWPHELQYTRPPCPSPTPRAYPNSCPWVTDAIQPSHPLSSSSPPPFSLSQHQGLFQQVSSSHQVAKVLELQLQHQSLQWIFRLISLTLAL